MPERQLLPTGGRGAATVPSRPAPESVAHEANVERRRLRDLRGRDVLLGWVRGADTVRSRFLQCANECFQLLIVCGRYVFGSIWQQCMPKLPVGRVLSQCGRNVARACVCTVPTWLFQRHERGEFCGSMLAVRAWHAEPARRSEFFWIVSAVYAGQRSTVERQPSVPPMREWVISR